MKDFRDKDRLQHVRPRNVQYLWRKLCQSGLLIERANTTSAVPIKTVLVVSASNGSNDAPARAYFKQSWTVPEIFEALLDECDVRGQAAEAVSTIKATFIWNKRAQLLRKDKPDDWNIFMEALRRAWNKHRNYFVESGCEIEMILCVEEGA